MKLLLKQVLIANNLSPFNGLTKDILIIDGKISAIDDILQSQEDVQVINDEFLVASAGWVDVFAHFNDPGFEYKETLQSGAAAAASGGFTHVFVLPNTSPAVSNKSLVEYVIQTSKSLPVHVIPLGAITKNVEGKELAEMYDMHRSGAVAFSDGLTPVQTPGLFLKALQYAKAFNGVLIQLPVDRSIGKFGLMNEGITSTRLGLPGIPAIAEEIMVSRDIELAKYTQSKMHITGISTKKSIELIKQARQQGIEVTCSVTPYHLAFCDEDLVDYDTNLKVDPPLRSRHDMEALQQGVVDGNIDCIATHHLPHAWDDKTCEFEYAKAGMIGLESCFPVINTIFNELPVDKLVNVLEGNARKIFNLNSAPIAIGSHADITLFTRDGDYIFTKEKIKSKSGNTPFLNKRFKGRVVGIINKDKVYLND